MHVVHPDAAVAGLARRQHGVVTAAQLAAAGLTRTAVAHRVETGQLTRLHRGVYRVGPTHGPLTSPLAAVLACGSSAALSHRAAAALHGFAKWPATMDVTTPARQRDKASVRMHRAPLPADEVTRVEGIRVTTVARTIVDLAAAAAPDLRRLIEEAQVQRRISGAELSEVVEAAAGRRGARALRAAAMTADPAVTRSEAERRLLRLVRQGGLPRPQTNVRIAGYEVDFAWRRERLVVEVDGFAFHSPRTAFERDRRKGADLTAAGWRVMRVTWRQIADEPHGVLARLAAALAVASAA